jgi:hypothetical protein
MFACKEVESEYYLLADVNIKCYSPHWYKGVIYASLMIFIYPVGIPMSYLWLLYQVKNDIALKNNHASFRQGSLKINNNKNNIDNNDNDFNDDDDKTKKTISIKQFQSDSIDYNNNNDDYDDDDDDDDNNVNYENNDYHNDDAANVCDQIMISNSPITSSKHHKKNNTSFIDVKSIRFLWEPYQEKYWFVLFFNILSHCLLSLSSSSL